MSNKSQLQTNNIDLQSILSTVLGLPTQESVKHGSYAWKKYNYSIKPSIVANIQDLPGSDGFYIFNSSDYQVTSSDFSLSKLDGGQTVGTSRTIYFTYTDKLYWSYTKGGKDDYQNRVDTNSDNLLIVANNYSCNFTGLTSIKFTEPSIGDFVDFVVADSESAYPDGGEQGGYWYEKVKNITDFLGFTKCAEDEFTFSSRTDGSSASISHSLGVSPKMVLILSYGNTFNTISDIMFAFWEGRYTYKTTSTYLCYYNTSYKGPSQSTCSIVVDANTVKLNTSSYYWGTGIKYKMITMA